MIVPENRGYKVVVSKGMKKERSRKKTRCVFLLLHLCLLN